MPRERSQQQNISKTLLLLEAELKTRPTEIKEYISQKAKI
jgi:hypothetical protein